MKKYKYNKISDLNIEVKKWLDSLHLNPTNEIQNNYDIIDNAANYLAAYLNTDEENFLSEFSPELKKYLINELTKYYSDKNLVLDWYNEEPAEFASEVVGYIARKIVLKNA